jgi:aminodeoxyfutalosine synthase
MSSKVLNRVRSLLERGERISIEDCRELFEVSNLLELARLARIPRERRFGQTASYKAVWPVAYNGEAPEFFISQTMAAVPEGTGYIAILCRWQRGETLELWRERLREFSRASLPVILHLSPSFILALSEVEEVPVGRIIGGLKEAGSIFVTGEGAELFDPTFRMEYSHSVLSPEDWISVHRAAHILSVKSGAAMTYGTLDRPEAYADHLNAIRVLQDETGGFVEFIPMALHNRTVETHLTAPTAAQTIRAIAISRIFLDNIDHIAAAPGLVSTEVAIVALDYGADTVITTIAVQSVHSEDRSAVSESALRVVDPQADPIFNPAQPEFVRDRIAEARWNPQAVNSWYDAIPVPETV